MVEETIQTIKQAEKEAGEIAAQADARCEQILSQASGEQRKCRKMSSGMQKPRLRLSWTLLLRKGKDWRKRRLRRRRS